MKLRTLIIAASVMGCFFFSSSVNAGYLDKGWENITTYDGFSGSYDGKKNEWWNENEDQEVEPGAATGQEWDLEGFFLSDGSNSRVADGLLAMVGGFNFAEGEEGIGSGDIFIDTDMDNDYYEYVLDLNFQFNHRGRNKSTYTAYENTTGNIKFNTTEGGPSGGTQGQAWTYKSGGTAIKGFENLALKYLKNKSDRKMGGGLTGGNHNAVIVDISFLGSDTGYNLWNTMKCGNDVLTGGEGGSAAVPEPATIFLLGSGLLGLFGYRKKFFKPKN